MNIILWTTVSYWFAPIRPIGCYQLASWLRQHGYTVKVIDFCHHLDPAQIVQMTREYIDDTTVAIGVSSTFWVPSEVPKKLEEKKNFTEPKWVTEARKEIEKEHPNLDWLLGGGGSILPNLKLDWIKFHGDAEDSLLKYMDDKFNYTQPREPFDITTAKKQYHETDFILPQETLSVELGRGCQFRCKFCRFHNVGKKKGTYIRSIKCVEEELLYNYEHFGTTKYYFIDDTVNEDNDKINQLAEMAQRLPFKLEWVGYIRADLVWSFPEQIQTLKQSGLRSAFIGIESFNKKTALTIGKGWSGTIAKDFMLELRRHWEPDISWYMSFIVGLPYEDKDSLRETVRWLKQHKFKSWRFFPLNIYRIPNLVYRSEFDKNYSQYGYRFPNPLSDIYWESDLWNTNTAIDFANELNSDSEEIWTAFHLADVSNLGYSIDDLMWKPLKEYDWQGMGYRKWEFVENYRLQTLNYKSLPKTH